ncbi:hypothetical protein GCM10007939_01910 [Amylibacter marinus]|uniref:Uncharacterized protein n=1 Tax=Amylibacter marinus TaxID=1475483 RepID=A0ABQ5VR69_9RHOB|nr:hypothetical protein [Amylibacter marinus]GLQ33908.1 hypothetical protein GCM10007939_01910 [Amylibacter marinus]
MTLIPVKLISTTAALACLAGAAFAQSNSEICAKAAQVNPNEEVSTDDCHCSLAQMETTLSPELKEAATLAMISEKSKESEIMFEAMQSMKPGEFTSQIGAYLKALETECEIDITQ